MGFYGVKIHTWKNRSSWTAVFQLIEKSMLPSCFTMKILLCIPPSAILIFNEPPIAYAVACYLKNFNHFFLYFEFFQFDFVLFFQVHCRRRGPPFKKSKLSFNQRIETLPIVKPSFAHWNSVTEWFRRIVVPFELFDARYFRWCEGISKLVWCKVKYYFIFLDR